LSLAEYEKDALRKLGAPLQQYDPDAFDSMAAMNSEVWNVGHNDGHTASVKDLLPNVSEKKVVNQQDSQLSTIIGVLSPQGHCY